MEIGNKSNNEKICWFGSRTEDKIESGRLRLLDAVALCAPLAHSAIGCCGGVNARTISIKIAGASCSERHMFGRMRGGTIKLVTTTISCCDLYELTLRLRLMLNWSRQSDELSIMRQVPGMPFAIMSLRERLAINEKTINIATSTSITVYARPPTQEHTHLIFEMRAASHVPCLSHRVTHPNLYLLFTQTYRWQTFTCSKIVQPSMSPIHQMCYIQPRAPFIFAYWLHREITTCDRHTSNEMK